MLKHHRGPRTWAATTAAGALAATSLFVALPATAGAEDTTCEETHLAPASGTFEWGVKETWRTYLEGRIANGGWKNPGAEYNGSAFVFSPAQEGGGLDHAGRGTLRFDGELQFEGHAGALDMTLSDFAVNVKGSRAEIQVDYVTYKSDMSYGAGKGEKITGNDVVIAEIELENTFRSGSSTLDLAGETTLTEDGAGLFQAYNAKDELDPTSGKIQLSTECGPVPGTSGGGARNTGGILGTFTDTISGINDLFTATGDLVDESQRLHDRVRGDDGGVHYSGDTPMVRRELSRTETSGRRSWRSSRLRQ